MDKLDTLVRIEDAAAVAFPHRVEQERARAARCIAELDSQICLLAESENDSH